MGGFFRELGLADFSCDEGLGDFEGLGVEDGEVGVEAWFDFAEALESEGLGLVPGGGFDDLVEGEAGEFGDIFHAVVEAECGASEGAAFFEDGFAVFHEDGEAAEHDFAFVDPGGGHGVGDHQNAVDGNEFEDEFEHVWAEVDFVADNFDFEGVIDESGADAADFSVVDGCHGVAEVGEVFEAVLFGFKNLGSGSGSVRGRAGDADFGGF